MVASANSSSWWPLPPSGDNGSSALASAAPPVALRKTHKVVVALPLATSMDVDLDLADASELFRLFGAVNSVAVETREHGGARVLVAVAELFSGLAASEVVSALADIHIPAMGILRATKLPPAAAGEAEVDAAIRALVQSTAPAKAPSVQLPNLGLGHPLGGLGGLGLPQLAPMSSPLSPTQVPLPMPLPMPGPALAALAPTALATLGSAPSAPVAPLSPQSANYPLFLVRLELDPGLYAAPPDSGAKFDVVRGVMGEWNANLKFIVDESSGHVVCALLGSVESANQPPPQQPLHLLLQSSNGNALACAATMAEDLLNSVVANYRRHCEGRQLPERLAPGAAGFRRLNYVVWAPKEPPICYGGTVPTT